MSKIVIKRKGALLFFAILILITALISLLTVIYTEGKKHSLIETKLGKVIGVTVKRLGTRVNCYFGVPYAEPPIGELRFRKPVPKKPWKDLLKAVKQPNYCWQTKIHKDRESKYWKEVLKDVPDWENFFDSDVSEDCLYLNIYVPMSSEPEPNRTVMVWIHGGSFRSGYISATNFDGSILAAHNQVIVVALNYRLGIFGFLSADETELTGNYGLHDQVMALEWVKQNIETFGGNPNNVVIFGESAGAISVGYHLISSLSDNLFSRAILQSGNAVVPIIMAGKDLQTNVAIDIFRGVSCPLSPKLTANSTQQINNSSLVCLRQVKASILFELSESVLKKRIEAFLPIEGNHFFAEHPYELVKKRKFNSNKEILIGTNAAEGVHFSAIGPFKKYWSSERVAENFTKDNVNKILRESVPKGYEIFVQIAVDYGFDGIVDDKDSVEVWNRYVKIVGDVIFVCSDYVFINEYSASNRTVYYYEFMPKPSYTSWGTVWANGAVHGDEIPFVFGIPLLLQRSYTLQEIQLSKTIMNLWTSFAKNGKPSSCNCWLEYKHDEPLYMSLDVQNSHMKQGFPGFKCQSYYDKFITESRSYVRSGQPIPV